MEDNISQQLEELEVLVSIFGDQWKICDSIESTYSISLTKEVELWVTLNKYYPSDQPPQYELWAPNLKKSQKDLINKEFRDIYEINRGSPIIFQWIEKLKEVINGEARTVNNAVSTSDEYFHDNLVNQFFELKTREVPEQPEGKLPVQLDIVHGSTITDRKSTFQAHVCKVTDPIKVNYFLEKLIENKKIAQATHNILAYRIITEKNIMIQDCDDDGETHAGSRLLHLMDILDLKNVAVVVSRWYGGIHLGPDRFRHINNAARRAFLEAGFIK